MSVAAAKPTGRPKGALPTFTEAQMLAAIKRVYAACGSCTQEDYTALRMDSEPSERTIRCRFGTFNKAKIQAGLPIIVKVRKSQHCRMRGLERETLTEYPCLKCDRLFKGRGRRKGNFHCPVCVAVNFTLAAGMGW